jgi:hypothetical protein
MSIHPNFIMQSGTVQPLVEDDTSYLVLNPSNILPRTRMHNRARNYSDMSCSQSVLSMGRYILCSQLATDKASPHTDPYYMR